MQAKKSKKVKKARRPSEGEASTSVDVSDQHPMSAIPATCEGSPAERFAALQAAAAAGGVPDDDGEVDERTTALIRKMLCGLERMSHEDGYCGLRAEQALAVLSADERAEIREDELYESSGDEDESAPRPPPRSAQSRPPPALDHLSDPLGENAAERATPDESAAPAAAGSSSGGSGGGGSSSGGGSSGGGGAAIKSGPPTAEELGEDADAEIAAEEAREEREQSLQHERFLKWLNKDRPASVPPIGSPAGLSEAQEAKDKAFRDQYMGLLAEECAEELDELRREEPPMDEPALALLVDALESGCDTYDETSRELFAASFIGPDCWYETTYKKRAEQPSTRTKAKAALAKAKAAGDEWSAWSSGGSDEEEDDDEEEEPAFVKRIEKIRKDVEARNSADAKPAKPSAKEERLAAAADAEMGD